MEVDPDETILLSDDCSVDDILRKYGIRTEVPKQPGKPLEKPIKTTKLKVFDLSDSAQSDDNDDLVDNKIDDYFDKIVSPPKKRKFSSPAKNNDKADQNKEKAARKLEVDQKRNEAVKNKEIKKLLSAGNKNLKPDECVKFVTTLIDETITNNQGTTICTGLQALGCDYNIISQLIANTVTWTRKCESHYMDDTGTLKTLTNIEETPDLLLILSAKELLDFIKEHKLIEHIKTIQSIYNDKNVSLGVLGLEKHFKNKKRTDALTRHVVTSALTEIQIFCNCCYRNVDGEADLGALLCQFTKSIAQRPYKLQQDEKLVQANWYIKGDNKDCVKVDKKGNGLKRLWQQQLTSFPLARLETAESIIDKYPCVDSLIQGYDACAANEREGLLADITIRRHAGPITSSRRIGRELSKKIHIFYNSLDGDAVIG